MTKVFAILTALLLLAPAALAGDHHGSFKDEVPFDGRVYDVTTAHGCYFYRGRRHCSRYCYVERNGYRYCQQRPRDAYPQADPPADLWIEEVYPRRSRW